jgi:hypothetical protein
LPGVIALTHSPTHPPTPPTFFSFSLSQEETVPTTGEEGNIAPQVASEKARRHWDKARRLLNAKALKEYKEIHSGITFRSFLLGYFLLPTQIKHGVVELVGRVLLCSSLHPISHKWGVRPPEEASIGEGDAAAQGGVGT